MATPRQMELARNIIVNFEYNQRPGWFTRFSRSEVAKSLKSHIVGPHGISQKDTPLCGVGAFIFSLASDQPEKYVKLVTELYDSGRSYMDKWSDFSSGIWIEPDDHLRHYRPSEGMDAADWIAMASVRDSSNWLFDYEKYGELTFVGNTFAGDIVKWLKKFGGYTQIVDKTNLLLSSDELNLHDANRYYLNKFRTILQVHHDMFVDPASSWSITANHWVVLDSPIIIGREQIHLNVYTWGRREKNKVVWKADFFDHYYGFIAAKY